MIRSAVLAAGVLLANPAQAALVMDFVDAAPGELEGDSEEIGHLNWIDLDAIDLGLFQVAEWDGTTRVLGPTHARDLVVTKGWDPASADLALEALRSTDLGTVVIRHVNGSNAYWELSLGEVAITSIEVTSSGLAPTERLSLSFRTMQLTVTTAAGPTTRCFDLVTQSTVCPP